jgi:type 1 glutamine amidotransferase
MPRLTVLATALTFSLVARASLGQEPKAFPPRRVVLIAGPLDKSHPRGTHEYEESVKLLKRCLDSSPNLDGLHTDVVLGGWPRDDRLLDRADTIVLISSGADRNPQDHPLLVGKRLAGLERQMKRGCGLVTIHWTTFVPNGKVGEQMLDWVGGYFDYQSGPLPQHWYSAIKDTTTTVKPGSAAHPVCRGLRPFRLHDEFYYHIRFRQDDPRLKPILLAALPGVAQDQVIAWAVERPDGGRGFGLTGGHYFNNWFVPEFRKLVLNAIAWTAHAEVPAGGVASTPSEGNEITLTEGMFGKALDARLGPVVIPGDERFRKPPLTVECWARLWSKDGFNILVASDPKTSARHWEIYSYAGAGDFSAYFPGMEPAEIRSGIGVCDQRWHHLAMSYDGKAVKLFVDGKVVKDQGVARKPGLQPRPGPLTIGAVVFGAQNQQRIGCDGLIDEVRVSQSLRRFDGPPKERPAEDAQTLGLWRFDRPEDLTGAQAWTPPPQEGDAAPWEKETDKDWVDNRFRQMDTGPFLGATVDYPVDGSGPRKQTERCYRATAIKVGAHGEGAVLFDRGQLRYAAYWTGGFLHHGDRRFGLLNTPRPAGTVILSTRNDPGWAGPKGEWGDHDAGMAPLPAAWAKYRGLYLHGKRTILAYTVGGVEVLDSPWVESSDGVTVLTRTIEVAPTDRTLRMLIRRPPILTASSIPANNPSRRLVETDGDVVNAVHVVGAGKGCGLFESSTMPLHLVMPPHQQVLRCKLLIWHGTMKDMPAFDGLTKASAPPADLHALIRPGPARWTAPIVTHGVVGKDDAPYVIDTLTVPYDNPHRALMFCGGLDFLPNGDVAVCTAHGDVWLVKGVNDKLEKLTWKRFATGLYQPLGLKVVDGKIHVLERGQLTRLHDLDGDGEADFYECVNNDWYVGGGEHSFDCCLETDPAGNFYFFKTGDAHTPTGGCLLRIAPDGSKTDIFATGFRQPICLAVSPAGTLTGSDQEGNWMPATRIDVYKQGGFYGDLRTHHRRIPPRTYDEPLCWLPRQADNSSGGEVWVPPGKLGPLSGRLFHLSYGRCSILLVMKQKVGDVLQGGAVDLGLHFLSGIMRGRVRPQDGYLYVCGLRGWQTAAVRDGCLQRVRYTGKPVKLPTSLQVFADGIRIGFTCPLDRRSAADVGNYHVQEWNYHWGPEYGSKRWSVAHPEKKGQDTVPVQSATLLPDGRSVFLRMAGLRPVMQMEIDYRLSTPSREPVAGVIYNTIHRAAEAFDTATPVR